MAVTSKHNEEFFANLDANFKNYSGLNEPMIFQSKDCLVQWHFELPIPTLPGSVVKYSKLMSLSLKLYFD